MSKLTLDDYKGNIYLSPDTWSCDEVVFLINKIADDDILEIKMLNIPDYKSYHRKERGYGQIMKSWLKECIILDSIMEITALIIIPKSEK